MGLYDVIILVTILDSNGRNPNPKTPNNRTIDILKLHIKIVTLILTLSECRLYFDLNLVIVSLEKFQKEVKYAFLLKFGVKSRGVNHLQKSRRPFIKESCRYIGKFEGNHMGIPGISYTF